MKFLHSSDWHLGKRLYGRSRYQEQEAFLSWLIDIINSNEVELFLLAGDVFDSSLPSNRAQELYYSFLSNLVKSSCKHAIIIGGNHDSPSLLTAPSGLLKMMNIHVIGQKSEQISDELIPLRDASGNLQALVCAAPYLRERDLRQVEAGESLSSKEDKLLQGIQDHYQDLISLAQNHAEYHPQIPIVVMGHLYMQESFLSDKSTERELYLGSIIRSNVNIFPKQLSYVALGHLHRCQKVGSKDHIRYSGSPIPLSFAEAKYTHQVLVGQIGQPQLIQSIKVPQTHILQSIEGDENQIYEQLDSLIEMDQDCYLELNYLGLGNIQLLKEDIIEKLKGSKVELIRFHSTQTTDTTLTLEEGILDLDSLDPKQVFEKCLEHHQIEEAEIQELWQCYLQILQEYKEADLNAE